MWGQGRSQKFCLSIVILKKTNTLGKYSSYSNRFGITHLYCFGSLGMCFFPFNNKPKDEYKKLKRLCLLSE